MTFRSIVKEDLPRLAKLVDNQELCTMEGLCLEHSKMYLDDDGTVTTIKVVDITGKLNNYVTLDEFMRRTAFIENESHN